MRRARACSGRARRVAKWARWAAQHDGGLHIGLVDPTVRGEIRLALFTLHTCNTVPSQHASGHECERCERRHMPSASDAVLGAARQVVCNRAGDSRSRDSRHARGL